jgi:hypothetical protein
LDVSLEIARELSNIDFAPRLFSGLSVVTDHRQRGRRNIKAVINTNKKVGISELISQHFFQISAYGRICWIANSTLHRVLSILIEEVIPHPNFETFDNITTQPERSSDPASFFSL